MNVGNDPERMLRSATRLHNDGDIDGFVSCYADPCLYHSGRDDRHLSREAHADAVRSFFEVFPDFRGTIESLMVDGERAYVRWTYTGTHLGTSRSGVAPTGKKLDVGTVFAEVRIANGLIVEVWELSSFVNLRDLATAS